MPARYDGAFLAMAGLSQADAVLDVGCGTGASTRAAARLTPYGTVTGIDLSSAGIEVAVRSSGHLGNVAFATADAETCALGTGGFNSVISRFGTMYFVDPRWAYTGIGEALRKDGQLTILIWQARERNEWVRVVEDCLGPIGSQVLGWTDDALVDPSSIHDLLADAGFHRINFTDVRQPLCLGADAVDASSFVSSLVAHSSATGRHRLRTAFAARQMITGEVLLNSAAWLVTARKT
ncbi:class I SAM-dependent methyltransferase [Kribbella sp. NPDC051770]|uniref:class I SAM-dependent methyltransferase n=1 Tax=Kribbella sp. NPDC051770 TaxID=3155413 RepID=UPI003426B0E0